jgi:hypothetical protein
MLTHNTDIVSKNTGYYFASGTSALKLLIATLLFVLASEVHTSKAIQSALIELMCQREICNNKGKTISVTGRGGL